MMAPSPSAAWNPTIIFDGGNGQDELVFTASGKFDLRSATLTSVERLSHQVGDITVLVDNASLTEFNALSRGTHIDDASASS